MSTFSGLIEELPGISVDRFMEDNLNKSTVFFLSHCHTDHMEGLGSEFFQQIAERNELLYCSPLTKTFLVTKWQLSPQLADRIVSVPVCNPIVVTYRNPKIGLVDESIVTVTTVPAGHCPGSVMFLFETKKGDRDLTILYTGDFRINPDDFNKLKPLHFRVNDKLVAKRFDNVYLDTTFYDENVDYLPTRQEALAEIVPVVGNWLGKDEKNVVVVEISANYGSEHLFVELSTAINERIHVRRNIEEGYKFIPEFSRYFTTDPYETRVHACMTKREKNVLNCRSPSTDPKNILTIIPSVQWWIYKKKDLTKAFTEFEEDSRRFYVCYSCHASCGELKKFIQYFNPLKVYPCVCPKNLSVDQMRKKIMAAPVISHSDVKYCFFDEEEETVVKRPKIGKSSDF